MTEVDDMIVNMRIVFESGAVESYEFDSAVEDDPIAQAKAHLKDLRDNGLTISEVDTVVTTCRSIDL